MDAMKRKISLISIVTWLAALCFSPSPTTGFEIKTHKAISARTVTPGISNLDVFLTSQLAFDFPKGINEIVADGKSVTQLVQDGSENEDCCLFRPRHHFHNPRLAWNQAGWRPVFFFEAGKSSILWSQDTSQFLGGKHSWHDARDSYFQALTATTDSERKNLYADTFRSLGHLIHLVQDAAAPSHTRNDTHISYFGDPDGLHVWGETEQARGMIGGMTPPALDPSFLNQASPDAQAPVPIARLIDANPGDIGTQGLTPGLSLGIAEYSSANFYSDDTINSTNFLSPLPNQIEAHAPELDATNRKRPYAYFKPGFGEDNYPLGLASALLPYVIDPLSTPTDVGLDTKVLSAYGAKLFPRAISYSAGLIDYFFRGRIFISQVMPDEGPPSNLPTTITLLNLFNITPDEETGNGTLQLVLLYRDKINTTDSFPNTVSNQVSGNISSSPQNATFSFSSLPFPATMGSDCHPSLSSWGWILCQSYVSFDASLVYRGPLGREADSVIVSRCSVSFDRTLFEWGLSLGMSSGEGC
jgi:hypothetical protein